MEWSFFLEQIVSFRFLLSFVPLFVAFDVLGILPLFGVFTMEMTPHELRRVVRQSLLTAFLVSIGFLAVGKSVFALLGISVSDFKVAGGVLLFIFAVTDLIFPERTRSFPKETIGVVPIGIPLIVGPAVLTLLLISVDAYGYFSTILCLTLNLLIVWFVFSQSRQMVRILKEGGAKGIGKVSSVLLAAFAVMMVRTGFTEWLA